MSTFWHGGDGVVPNLPRIVGTPAGVSAALLTVSTPSGVVTGTQSEEIEHNSMSRTRTRIRTSVALEKMQVL